MKTRIVPSSELSTKTLCARDYVLKPYKVTYMEEIERDAIVYLPEQTEEEAMESLSELDDSDFIAAMDKGRKVDLRVLERELVGLKMMHKNTERKKR